jgi:hypothetical protein
MSGLFAGPDCTSQQRLQPGLVFSLQTPVQEGGVTLFRQTLHLCVAVDDRCQRIVVGPGSQLALRFEPSTLAITRGDSAWVQRWQDEADRATVELTYPAPILAVHSEVYRKVALHRVDGDAVSEQPTVSASTGQALAEPLVAPSFQARLSDPRPAVVARKTAEHVLYKHQSLAAMAVEATGHSVHDAEWEATAIEALLASGLTRLDLRGQPTSPRLRLMNGDQSEVLWQWLEPGAHPSPVSYTAAGADLEQQWQAALARALAQRPAGVTRLVLPLHIESDAPCRVVAQQATLDLLLETQLLAEPLSLDFDGTHAQVQDVPVPSPPPHAESFTLSASTALRSPAATAPPVLSQAARYTGAALQEGEQLAIPWTTGEPVRLLGVALAWYPLSAMTRLRLALVVDGGEQPAARVLTEGTIEGDALGSDWLQCRWDALTLQTGRYWLRVQVEQGNGVWLGEAVGIPRAAWRQGGATGHPVALPLALRLQPLEVAPLEASTSPLQVALNGLPLTLTATGPGAVTARLSPVPPALAANTTWTLTLQTPHASSVTLKSAQLAYRAD